MDILRVMNKRKKLALVVILCIAPLVMARMGISTRLSNEDINLNTNEVLRPRSATEHGPISIRGNAELAAFCAGNGTDGTESNPHIIEGYEINLTSYSVDGISIEDTDLHLVIKNCTITDGSSNNNNNWMYNNYNGIDLYNCSNVKIVNNELKKNDYGIHLYSSSNNTVSGNNCSANNHDGIYMSSSNNTTFLDNIYMNNNDDGISLDSSINNSLSGNEMFNCGIMLSKDCNRTIIDTTNTIGGKSVHYFKDESGVSLSGETNMGQIILDNCTNCYIEGIEIKNASRGIILLDSHNNTILNNDFTMNSKHGMYLSSSLDNVISYNNCSNNGDGIEFDSSYNNTVSFNDCSKNDINGIDIRSYINNNNNNTITYNNCSMNKMRGIYIYGSQNIILGNNCSYNRGLDNPYSNYFFSDHYGIDITGDNNNISQNYVSKNKIGISIWGSNNHVENNTIEANENVGIFVNYNNNTFKNNKMKGNGILIPESLNTSLDTTNTVNGKPILYFENQNNIVLSGEEAVGQLILVNCNNSVIENLEISNATAPIQLTCSHNNTISHCKAFHSTIGILLSYSIGNNITENAFFSNSRYGFWGRGLGSSTSWERVEGGNLIWNNNIYANNYNQTCYEDLDENQWYYNETGNYYGDYTDIYPTSINDGRVWDTPYEIEGGTNVDLYPLVEPVSGILPRPESPSLTPIESPSTSGNISLSWDEVEGADSYSVYRSTSEIINIGGLTPIISGHTSTFYLDLGLENGTYYYAVVAHADELDSEPSNCESVTVEIPAPNVNSGDETDDDNSGVGEDPTGDENSGQGGGSEEGGDSVAGFPFIPLFMGIAGIVIILSSKRRPE